MDTRNFSSHTLVHGENKEKDCAVADLPTHYGRTEAFLLPKDPDWLFLFWEITGLTYDYIKSQNGYDIFDRSKTIVRLHDTTNIIFDGFNSHSYTDTDIVFEAKSWYLRAPKAGRAYVADIGIITPQGRFILLARSNAVTLPPGQVSDKIDEKWMLVEDDYKKIMAMSGVDYIGRGASELVHVLEDKWRAAEITSSLNSSQAILQDYQQNEEELWLKADCEIVIYGCAAKDAVVKINGKEARLDDSGCFSLRQSLQKDEKTKLLITAEKNKIKKSLKIKAERED